MFKNVIIAAASFFAACTICYAQVATVPAGGRITINPGVSEMRTDYVSASKVYYAPHRSGLISVFDGVHYNAVSILSSPTDAVGIELDLDSRYSPNTIFDLFIYSTDGASGKACAVPWAYSAPGVGSRATPLGMFGGQVVNAAAAPICMTSGGASVSLPQYQGTYIGKFYTSSTAGYIDFKFGNAGVGGGAARVAISNADNQVDGVFVVQDTNITWTPLYNSWEALDIRCAGCSGGQTNTITFLSEGGAVSASVNMAVYPSSGNNLYVSVDLNNTGAPWSKCANSPGGPAGSVSIFHAVVANCGGYVPDGVNYLQAMEQGAAGVGSFYSNQGATQLGTMIARFKW